MNIEDIVNDPSGYPKRGTNPAFEKVRKKLLEEIKETALKARAFLYRLRRPNRNQ